MPSPKAIISFASAAATTLASLGAAQELTSAIGGCGEVQCPNAGKDSIENVCTLQNRTFSDVGASDFGHALVADNLTWVQGSNRSESEGSDTATVTSSFYLGTPFEYDAGSVRACAAFFHQTEAKFGGDAAAAANISTASGTCEQAGVSRDCIDALVARAQALEIDNQDEDACARLQDEFRKNLDKACVDVAGGGDKWKDVNVRRESYIYLA